MVSICTIRLLCACLLGEISNIQLSHNISQRKIPYLNYVLIDYPDRHVPHVRITEMPQTARPRGSNLEALPRIKHGKPAGERGQRATPKTVQHSKAHNSTPSEVRCEGQLWGWWPLRIAVRCGSCCCADRRGFNIDFMILWIAKRFFASPLPCSCTTADVPQQEYMRQYRCSTALYTRSHVIQSAAARFNLTVPTLYTL